MRGQRDLDIVIYGATGFVGGLVAESLAKAGQGLRVGLAGRSAERLRAVRHRLGVAAEQWPVIAAALSDQAALEEMASRSQVVISTVGPYSRYGLPLVAACAATGTDYADLAGEVPFVHNSIERHHRQAVETGARIVHSCGFDSIPSDLSVYALHRRAERDAAGRLGETTLVLRTYSGGCSGGSVQTMVEMIRLAGSDPRLRSILDDPYSLSPDRTQEPDLGAQPDVDARSGSEIAPELAGLWMGGYLMALYNTRCVRRTNALLGWPYGRQMRYTETLSYGSSLAAPMLATMSGLTITAASRLGGAYLQNVPSDLLDRMMPTSGTGYDEGARGYYKTETYTRTTSGKRYVATMSQRGDPGYSATATLLVVSALIMARGRERMSDLRGVLTPVAAMGDALLAELPVAGVSISAKQLT
ncbi:MAG: saccharopine dehydrogenase NADP-binding domain-containing protein [Mycobacterium sp.]